MIRRDFAMIQVKKVKLHAQLLKLQDECQHPDVKKVARANTGNYDPSADSYWNDCKCPDCGKHWVEDQ